MRKFYALVMLICITSTAIGQVSISNDNSGPDPSAMLDVKSTDRGFFAAPDDKRTDEFHRHAFGRPAGLQHFGQFSFLVQWHNLEAIQRIQLY